MDKFEQMVETIEEAEDMVECKECFDLFPKAECTKMDHGYVCPTCGREQQPQDFSDVSFTDITTDLYDQEFPDVREYDSEFGPEMEERQKDYHVDDIVDALIKDEYNAIESYELADEMIQEADVEEDIKDDLLDAIEHIKKEEEEHIDEINNAAGRVEADPEDEDKKDDDSEEDSDSKDEDDDKDEDEDDKDSDKEDDDKDEDEDDKEKNEDLTEAVPSPEMVEGEEILDEKKESVFDKIWKPVRESCTWICRFKDQEIGTVEAETEEEAAEKMQQQYPEYNYSEYDGCFEVCKEAVFSETETTVLSEGIFSAATYKTIDKIFTNGYALSVKVPTGDERPAEHGKVVKDLKSAIKAAQLVSKNNDKATVYVIAKKIDDSSYSPAAKKLIDIKGEYAAVLAVFKAGSAIKDLTSEFAKKLKSFTKNDKKLQKIFGTDTATEISDAEDVRDAVDNEPSDVNETETAEVNETETSTEDTVEENSADPAPASAEAPAQDSKSVKRKEANKKIAAALKASGMSDEDISKLFKANTIATIRKAILGESLTEDLAEEEIEETVECAWCNREIPKCECRKEVDMGWLCDKCERAINSRGETLTFEQ